jgi:hypothetical protein
MKEKFFKKKKKKNLQQTPLVFPKPKEPKVLP